MKFELKMTDLLSTNSLLYNGDVTYTSVVMKQNAFMTSDVGFFFLDNRSRPCWRGELNHFSLEKNISQHIEGQCLFLNGNTVS